MPPVKFSRVISVTSEDPRYPAKNLLNSNVVSPWKCKEPGEKQAAVILQLEESCVIQGIDIGNENSAFIEIFVGKSITPDSFEMLRVASVLMSVQDCKNEKNKNTVRFFKQDEFDKPASNQSWDQLKIVCTQPFNKYAQYGLSFVKVHAKNEAATPVSNSIFGKFALKKDENEEESISTGSFFAKRKTLSDDVSAAAAIRQASSDPSGSILNKITSSTKRLSDLLPNKNAKKARTNGDINDDTLSNDCRRSTTGRLLYSQDDADDDFEDNVVSTPTTPTTSQNKNQSLKPAPKKRDTPPAKKNTTPSTPKNKPKANDTPTNPKNTPKRDDTSKPNATRNEPAKKRTNLDPPTGSQKKAKIDLAPKRKPFNKLLEGVVFAISGYQNPFRGELRSKALKLGAKYRADWDDSCTHLICAFTNTPKFNQVLGQGWIVRKDWIEDCFKLRKRLRSSGYKLDKNDPYTNSNDEEIWELDKNATTQLSESSLKEEKVSSQPLSNTSSNDLGGSPHRTQLDTSSRELTSQPDIYDVETDIDSEHEDPQLDLKYETVSMKVLPDFFKNKKFYLGTDLLQSAVKTLRRYIVAYKGQPHEDVDDVDYIISEHTRYKDNVSGTPVVLPDWIWECSDQKKLVPVDNYAV